ncbi:DEAD/DEAH box helicase [Pyrobaculum neutrophilum]|uniref:DEAD/DEAH box helicase domain protein n=1 Tax=Pyrobaculum neutrophilum (strain DSM 2338 / JCM 9278 / NBRC 100436 / V24Sta) TaxID=444157 RepID=B1Y930_PYRNV|nr:DEAD/DEAH box helicase [Pyrobaculum neutrophilum]ACB40259.1 DEAD/DEAH box helicase domain protein [Pyrobaculum neutrophilum V24Sta]
MVFDLLHPRLQAAIRELGYLEPTPAQERGIPAVLSGSHVLIIAPTGFGKTEAALFPIISRMLEGGGRALYITPLRSLNRDLLRRLYALAEALGLSMAVRHGDTPESERRLLATRPPDILITTPESLQILLLHRRLRRSLSSVRFVVVDEVHELVGSKRGVQLAVGLERLVELAGEFQRVGLSATVGNPALVAEFLGGVGRRVEIVDVSGEKKFEVEVVLPTPTDEDYIDAEKLDATPEAVARVKKVAEFVKSSGGAVLVFTNTRDGAEFLASRLRSLLGSVVEVHHSSLSREHRVSVEERLKRGELKAVVATSSLELGIDIGEVDLVIQYGSPRQVAKLIQRVGRSGHRLGQISRGVVVASDLEDMLESEVISAMALARLIVDDVEYHENALDVLVHQIVGIALEARVEGRDIDVGYVMRVVKRAHPYRNLTEDDLKLVLDFAERHRLLRGLRPRRGSVRYYYEGVSTIPDEKSYRAVDETTGRVVGQLDREFVYAIEPGTKIVLSGRVWVFSRKEGETVYLYPDFDITGALPSWIGEQIPVPRQVAQEVCTKRADLLREALEGRGDLEADLEGLEPDLVPMSDRLHIHIVGGKYAVLHSCLGSKGNEALGLYLSHALSGYVGPVGYRADAYRVLLIFRDHVPVNALEEMLKRPPEFIFRTLRNAVKSSRMFRYRFLQVARRVGLVSKEAEDVPSKLVDVYMDDVPGIETLNEIFVEKLDVKALLDLVERISGGKLQIVVRRLAKPTLLERPILEEALRLDFTFRGLSRETLADLARKRILNKFATLLCLNCGWTFTARASMIPEDVSCQRCGMRALAVVKGVDLEKARQVLNKHKLRQKLSAEERRLLEHLQQSASIVLEHGKTGVIIQLAHGVGPKTAIRVLNKVFEGADLWSAILDAERQYSTTRAFWD